MRRGFFYVPAAAFAALIALSAAAVTKEDMLSFPVAWNPEIPEGAQTTRPALTTSQKLLYLPRRKAGFGFVSNIERVAYVSPDAASCIHFAPINASKKPVLHIEPPEGVEIYCGFRDFSMVKKGRVYRFDPGSRASKYTFWWRLTKPMPAGTKLKGRYWGVWPKGTQEPQTLDIEVVRIPRSKGFKTLPVYYSMPSDFYSAHPDLAGLKRCGVNLLDVWTYVGPGESWGWKSLEETVSSAAKVPGLDVSMWTREWWWERGRATDEGAATLANGSKTRSALCFSYRGKHFRDWIEQGEKLIDKGFYFHSVDPEMYGGELMPGKTNADAICHCGKCKAAYGKYLAAYPDGTRADFAARGYAAFFAEYRKAMETRIASRGKGGKFKFMIYNAYHRSFAGFASERDYRKSPAYTRTFEDPVHFEGIFDILAPMVYMDVYANYNPYDMLLPWRDVFVMDRITGGKMPVAPILCAGYPFMRAFDCDTNADMLKWNIIEAASGGAKGFGIWGECPFDAKDMKAVAEAVNALAPFEKILASGRPGGKIRCTSANAVVKRVDSPAGSVAFVSEYSERPLKVTIEADVGGRTVRKTVRLGKERAVAVLLK